MQSIDFVKTGISLVYIINLSKVRFSSSFCYIYSYLSNPYVYYEKTWHAEKEQVSVTTTISKKTPYKNREITSLLVAQLIISPSRKSLEASQFQ